MQDVSRIMSPLGFVIFRVRRVIMEAFLSAFGNCNTVSGLYSAVLGFSNHVCSTAAISIGVSNYVCGNNSSNSSAVGVSNRVVAEPLQL